MANVGAQAQLGLAGPPGRRRTDRIGVSQLEAQIGGPYLAFLVVA